MVIDIGGGSTEIILGRGQELLFAQSLDIGAVRLTERFISKQPVPPEERAALEEFVRENIQAVLPELKKFPLHEILAVAGTPTALAAIELGGFDPVKVEGYPIDSFAFEILVRRFRPTFGGREKAKIPIRWSCGYYFYRRDNSTRTRGSFKGSRDLKVFGERTSLWRGFATFGFFLKLSFLA